MGTNDSPNSIEQLPEQEQNTSPIKLTSREKQIITLICSQYSTSEIAKELYLSPRTIEGHRNKILEKTGCRNIAGLVLFAIKYGLFTIPI